MFKHSEQQSTCKYDLMSTVAKMLLLKCCTVPSSPPCAASPSLITEVVEGVHGHGLCKHANMHLYTKPGDQTICGFSDHSYGMVRKGFALMTGRGGWHSSVPVEDDYQNGKKLLIFGDSSSKGTISFPFGFC